MARRHSINKNRGTPGSSRIPPPETSRRQSTLSTMSPRNLPESTIRGRARLTSSHGIFSLAMMYKMKVARAQETRKSLKASPRLA